MVPQVSFSRYIMAQIEAELAWAVSCPTVPAKGDHTRTHSDIFS